jgi:uncharacterized membrane protein YeaQ/YmgE (transglycosylase-associated protein family)
MHLSNESLLVILLVGLIAGWLAGKLMRGSGFGLIGDLIVGLLGALIGDWLLPRLHIHLGVGIVALCNSLGFPRAIRPASKPPVGSAISRCPSER